MTPTRLGILLASLALALHGSAAQGDEFGLPEKRFQVTWVDTAPTLDGQLDDDAWQRAPVRSDFHQVFPVQNGEPSYLTEVRIATDGEMLYFAFRCHDGAPDEIVANRMLRDDLAFYDDRVNIVIDTFHDRRNGYFFQVNPNGMRRDGLIEGPRFESNWNTIWFAAASRDAGGWTAEIALPFRSISFDQGSDTWGLNLSRGIRRNDEEVRWADPAQTRIVTSMGTAGVLAGMTGAQQGIGLDVVPAATTRYVRDPLDLGGDDKGRSYSRFDPSLDAFYKATSGLTASLTVNTDFGETEVDERQINLDRFSLFFPEKRDFFLQDTLIFDFARLSGNPSFLNGSQNGRPFFSRRVGLSPGGEIVGILAGAKLTGRVGPVNLGILSTQLEQGTHASSTRLSDGRFAARDFDTKNVGVVRAAVNVLEESSLGAIFTYGDPNQKRDNFVGGVDFNYSKSDFFGSNVLRGRGWYQQSDTPGLGGRDRDFGLRVEYPNDRIFWGAGFHEVQENFNPALGFVNRSGIRRYEGEFRYRYRRSDAWLRTVDSRGAGLLITDRDDEVDTASITWHPLDFTTDIVDRLTLIYVHRFERIEFDFEIGPGVVLRPDTHHFDEAGLRFTSSRNRQVFFDGTLTGGTFYSGERLALKATLEWRPNRHWLLATTYEHNEIFLPEGDFRSQLLRVRLNIQFTADLAWLTLVQWDNSSDTMGVNSRLQWILQQGHELFVVLNQDVTTEGGDFEAGRTEPLIKLGWTFRF